MSDVIKYALLRDACGKLALLRLGVSAAFIRLSEQLSRSHSGLIEV